MKALRAHAFWEPGGAYRLRRIPGMVVTARGTILAYMEARRAADDWASMDILPYRSEDGGATFRPPRILARGSKARPTADNPVMAQGGDGAIHFLRVENYGTDGGRVLLRTSRDDGLS